MTVRDAHGSILSREAYSYEFDKFGNWTKMLTSLVVFENGEVKREPVEVTYRTLTYYFDDSIAKIIAEPKASTAPAVPEPAAVNLRAQEVLQIDSRPSSPSGSVQLASEPPPLIKRAEPEGVASAYAGRKRNEPLKSVEPAPKAAPDNAILADHQKTANDFYLAGRDRFEMGDAPGAIDSYLQSIKLEPASAEVHLSLAHAYLKLEKDREAVKAFKESIKLNPAVAEAHYGLGFSNFRLGRFKDAADAFKKATSLEPTMAKAHFGLSLAYQELSMTSALMDEYRILEKLDRNLAKKLAQTFPQFNFSCRLVRGCP
jgi:tetratricopeptide (TPR) repeat protein